MSTKLHIDQQDESGLATTELALLAPVLFALVLGIAQAAIWAHANNVAQGAADYAAEVASAYGSSPEEGVAAGNAVVSGSGLLKQAVVGVHVEIDTVVVSVEGNYPTVFGRWAVVAHSEAIREQPKIAS